MTKTITLQAECQPDPSMLPNNTHAVWCHRLQICWFSVHYSLIKALQSDRCVKQILASICVRLNIIPSRLFLARTFTKANVRPAFIHSWSTKLRRAGEETFWDRQSNSMCRPEICSTSVLGLSAMWKDKQQAGWVEEAHERNTGPFQPVRMRPIVISNIDIYAFYVLSYTWL